MKQTTLSMAVHGPLHCLGWILFAVLLLNSVKKADASSYVNPSPEGESWAPCGFAAEQLAAEGNGSTYGSCLACDPTNFECPPKCQSLINAMYKQCDGVYAPQDQYFDPRTHSTATGTTTSAYCESKRLGADAATQLVLGHSGGSYRR
ncbi:hypothetical protein GQ600_24801 [Phytophthora cactorum]|nr:hypothetical protein GQ600_24801 [Phytophthora cactorum]